MPELKIHLPDELDKRFRKAAMKVHGYGRGSISKAAIEAFAKWCAEHEPIPLGPGESTLKEERIALEPPKDEKTRESSESKQGEPFPRSSQTLLHPEHRSRRLDPFTGSRGRLPV